MNKKEIKNKLAQMDDVYCEGFQGNVIDWEDCLLELRKIVWESIPPEIRDHYNWILECERAPPEFDSDVQQKQKQAPKRLDTNMENETFSAPVDRLEHTYVRCDTCHVVIKGHKLVREHIINTDHKNFTQTSFLNSTFIDFQTSVALKRELE